MSLIKFGITSVWTQTVGLCGQGEALNVDTVGIVTYINI